MAQRVTLIIVALALLNGTARGKPSSAMVQALKYYEAGDYHQASILLHNVIDDGKADRQDLQRAEFWLGKTLYHMGFHSGSLGFFARVVQAGPKHAYHLAALKWLVALVGKLPDDAAVVRKIGSFKPDAVLAAPALKRLRDDLAFLLGQHNYRQGAFSEAVRLFQLVGPTSKRCMQARLMAGMAQVRRFHAREAATAFKDALRAARTLPATPETRRLEQLARLSLARLFYSTRQYRLAVKHYGKVPAGSIYRQEALREQAWAYYRGDELQRALTNLRATPGAEALLLEAQIHLARCSYPQSLAAIRRLEARYAALPHKLSALLKQHADPTDFYKVALQIKQGRGVAAAVAAALRETLGERRLERSLQMVDELDGELKQVQSAPAAWKATAIAGVVLQDLTLQRSLAVNEAGQLARIGIQREVQQIKDQLAQARKVRQEAHAASKRPPGCKGKL